MAPAGRERTPDRVAGADRRARAGADRGRGADRVPGLVPGAGVAMAGALLVSALGRSVARECLHRRRE